MKLVSLLLASTANLEFDCVHVPMYTCVKQETSYLQSIAVALYSKLLNIANLEEAFHLHQHDMHMIAIYVAIAT